jgi:mannose-1-phosphate guanylyltransferase
LLHTDQSVVVLNGDVISAHNLAEQIRQHEANGADVTLHLTQVEDARAFGCVPTDSQGRVTAFLEKMENPVTNQINAGCYVFNPQTIESIPLNTVVSVERESFPQLVNDHAKIFGYIENAYWLDIGTPKALLKASVDIVLRTGQSLLAPGAAVDSTAAVVGGSCIGRGSTVGAGSVIDGSIVESDVVIGSDVKIVNSYVAAGTVVDNGAQISASFLTKGEILQISQ